MQQLELKPGQAAQENRLKSRCNEEIERLIKEAPGQKVHRENICTKGYTKYHTKEQIREQTKQSLVPALVISRYCR